MFSKGGTTPADAAKIILDGVKNEEWRILVGPDAVAIDQSVRKAPLTAYDATFGFDDLPGLNQANRAKALAKSKL